MFTSRKRLGLEIGCIKDTIVYLKMKFCGNFHPKFFQLQDNNLSFENLFIQISFV